MRKFGVFGVLLTLVLGASMSGAQRTKSVMPTVSSANVPLYPSVIRTARIQGDVVLRVSTDGLRVSTVEAEGGPPMLVEAAKENVKTWQFEPHKPTSFQITFHYKLLLPTNCDSECNCDSEERESVLLQLPTDVKVSAKIPAICDPLGKVE